MVSIGVDVCAEAVQLLDEPEPGKRFSVTIDTPSATELSAMN